MLRSLNIAETLLGIIFCISLSIILTVFFPQPYYFIGGGIDLHSSYDAEADYFANIISTYINGYSLDFIHPGIPISYFSAFLLSVFKNIDSVEEIFSLARAGLIFLNLIFIYLGSRIVLKQNISSFFILLIILLFYPSGFLLIDHVSPNSILFGLGVLIISLGYKLGEKFSFTQLALYAFTVGLTVSIKYTSLIFILPFVFSLLLIKNNENNKISFFKAIILLAAFITLSFCLFSWPIVPFVPFVFTQLSSTALLIDLLFSINVYLLLLVTLALLITCIIISRIFRKSNLSSIQVYTFVSGFMLLCTILYSLFSFFTSSNFAILGYSLRNYLPFLALFVIFLPKSSVTKHYFLGNPYITFSIFLLFLLVKINFNNNINNLAFKEDRDFSSFIEKISLDHDNVVFYPASQMSSRELFITWSDYRYGDTNKSFFEEHEKIPFTINNRLKKMRILNSRYYDLPDPTKKTGFIYFNTIKNSNFFTKSQQNNASKQISLLMPKSLCSNPFEDYSSDKSSVIIFPASLTSYYRDNDSSKPDLAIIFVEKLRKDFSEQCNLKTNMEEIFYKDQKFYLLSII